jgi:hypothetical protein
MSQLEDSLYIFEEGGCRVRTGGLSMLTAAECRAHSDECVKLAKDPGIPYQRARILFAMSRNWTALAGQKDQYDALLKEEEGK